MSLKENLNVFAKILKVAKTFSIPIEKEVIEIDKDGNESVATVSYKIKFIDSARFMATFLSDLVDNFRERIDKIKCGDFDCFLEYESLRDILVKHKCLSCNRDDSNIINEELKDRRGYLSFLIMISIIFFVVKQKCLSF